MGKPIQTFGPTRLLFLILVPILAKLMSVPLPYPVQETGGEASEEAARLRR